MATRSEGYKMRGIYSVATAIAPEAQLITQLIAIQLQLQADQLQVR